MSAPCIAAGIKKCINFSFKKGVDYIFNIVMFIIKKLIPTGSNWLWNLDIESLDS